MTLLTLFLCVEGFGLRRLDERILQQLQGDRPALMRFIFTISIAIDIRSNAKTNARIPPVSVVEMAMAHNKLA